MIKPYGIYLIEFPYSDMFQSKLRPAIALTKENASREAIFCFITSQLTKSGNFDLWLEPSPYNGLRIHSLVKIDKLATISRAKVEIIKGRIGYLEKRYINKVKSLLRNLFQL